MGGNNANAWYTSIASLLLILGLLGIVIPNLLPLFMASGNNMRPVFIIGMLSLLIGFILPGLKIHSRGEMETEIGRFKGPVWFIFMAFGLMLMLLSLILGI